MLIQQQNNPGTSTAQKAPATISYVVTQNTNTTEDSFSGSSLGRQDAADGNETILSRNQTGLEMKKPYSSTKFPQALQTIEQKKRMLNNAVATNNS